MEKPIGKREYSLIETVTAAMLVLVTLTMLIPAGTEMIKRINVKKCSQTRQRIEIRYEEYEQYRQPGETFLAYVKRNVDHFDTLCPEGGRYLILVSDGGEKNAAAHVYCTAHSEDYRRIDVPKLQSPEDALEFAGQIYALGSLYLAQLMSAYDEVYVDDALSFERISQRSTGLQALGSEVFTAKSGNETKKIEASEEFRALLNYNGNELSVGKIYFKKDANGAPLHEIDYVVVRQGDIWAKYAPNASVSGIGPMEESKRP